VPEEKKQKEKLAKANKGLEAISYIATHYLQEPFREDQIIYLVQEVQQFRQQAPIVQIAH
jgi:light-regulated signal transduction histidine kinase (bacteriophytochrome)